MCANKKTVAASFFIALGCVANLSIEQPLGAIFFAFGLLMVCTFDASLFTGKCGYTKRIGIKRLLIILGKNLVSAWYIGFFLSLCIPNLATAAAEKVTTWSCSWQFFAQSILCGMIMYLAVETYKRGSKVGIIYGIPLFILSGFQHCIANAVYMGMARADYKYFLPLFICILGNWIGSLIIHYVTTE
jgi:formate/nitrite transporter FocA (FNT family)